MSMLMTLPTELLQKLMTNLELQSMLRFRMTCKTLYGITAPRDAWVSMARSTAQQFHIPKTEEAIEDYTTTELENWVTRRHIVQSIWNSPEGPKFHQRRFSCPVGKSAPILLPGGRWLLTNDKSGALYSMDLNASKLEKRLLISPGSRTEGPQFLDPLTSMTYWVDPAAPRLTCRIALWSSFRHDKVTRILIYEVQMTGHADNASLVARPIQSICRPGLATAHLAAIDGQYLIQWKFGCNFTNEPDDDSTSHCMQVFRYNEPSDSGIVEPVIVKMKQAPFHDMYLLPHGRVVFTSREGLISIYAIPTASQKRKTWEPLHEFRAFNEPLIFDWTSDFRSSIHHISPTCTTILYSIKGLQRRHEILALRIPHESSKEPSATPIYSFDIFSPPTKAIDLSRTVAIETTAKTRINFLNLSWDPASPELEQAQVKHRQFDLPRGVCEMVYAPYGGFDAGLGRIILYSKKFGVLEVYDTILRDS